MGRSAGYYELGTGVQEGLKSVYDMVRHPVDTAKAFGSSVVDAAKAVPDVVRNLGDSETRSATVKGFLKGGIEGGTGADIDEAKRNPTRAMGRFLGSTVAPAVVLKGAKAGVRNVQGARRAAAATAAAERAEMAPVARGLGGDVPDEVVARGLAEGKQAPAGSRVVNPNEEILKDLAETIDAAKKDARYPGPSEGVTVSSTMPPENLAQPDVSYPRLVTGAKKVKKAEPAPPPTPEGGRLVNPTEEVLRELRETIDAARQDARYPGPSRTAVVSSTMSHQNLAQPPVSYPRLVTGGKRSTKTAPKNDAPAKSEPPALPEREARGNVRGEGGSESRPVAPAPARAAAPESAPAPVSAPRAPGIPTTSKDGQRVVVRPKQGVVSGLRNAVGAEKAARQLGVKPDDVRRAAPGPSRRPYAAEMADDDANYRRRIADERGFIDPKLALKLGATVAGGAGGAALANDDSKLAGGIVGALTAMAATNPMAAAKRFNELRMIGMLSGGALPKSVLGNIGAHLNAAGELGSMKPIKEMLRVPTNLKNAKAGWKAQTQPGGGMTSGAKVQGLGRLNVPGRVMGAFDDASQESLKRSGVSPERAKQLTLMEDNPAGFGANALQRAFDTRIGKFLVPFQRVPLNQFSQGAEALDGLLPRGKNAATVHNSGRGRALTAGAIGAGAVTGDETENPLFLAMMAALAGSRGMPFALGAGGAIAAKHGGSKSKSVLDRVGMGLPDGSMSDVFQPWRAIDKPALIRFIEQLQGKS